MRIIAGSARSLPLKSLPGLETRPTTDRIKETLFNIISSDVPGATFLDLFAGSGQIGLEAISRGAKKAVFVDNNKKACSVIEDNINFTKFTDKSKVYCTECLSALRQLEGKERFDIIFMDPPYALGVEREILSYISSSSLLENYGIIIVEADIKTDLSFALDYGLCIYKEKTYKTNKHVFLSRGVENEKSNLSR